MGLSCASDSLRAKAASDLHCEEDQLQVSKRTELAQDVNGCGQQATYVRKCDGCEWAMSPPGMMP